MTKDVVYIRFTEGEFYGYLLRAKELEELMSANKPLMPEQSEVWR